MKKRRGNMGMMESGLPELSQTGFGERHFKAIITFKKSLFNCTTPSQSSLFVLSL